MINGLFQIPNRAQFQREIALIKHRNDLYRNVPCTRIVLQSVQDRPSMQSRQVEIQGDGLRLKLFREEQRLFSGAGNDSFETGFPPDVQHDSAESHVVFNNEQNWI